MQYVITPVAHNVEPIAWWEGAFTEKELNWLQQKAKLATQNAQVGFGGGGAIDPNIRRSNVDWLNNTPETVWVFDKLAHVTAKLNAQFFNFDLLGFGEALQLTHYDQSENGMYGWHQDYGGGVSRKLSLTVQLTDPSEYEGGNFEIMTGASPKKMQKQRGLIFAFPSFIVHQVTPVTEGSRQSLVAWISGAPFK
jgi:PKHD-type hydroxylase